MRHVVEGLKRGQHAAREVQEVAKALGARDNRPYGSMWSTRYRSVVEQFELADLPGYEPIKPKGASYNLAVVNGRVLIPFRHATDRSVPIRSAKLGTKIPHRVSRDNGLEPAPTLFSEYDADNGIEDPTVAEAARAARDESLTVVYVAYVANADSDDVLAAWWGTPMSLEDDGTMAWEPEALDLTIASEHSSAAPAGEGLRLAGTDADVPGFAQGEMPQLGVSARPNPVEQPSAEAEPVIELADDGDE
jgi:hypothetical protein